MSSYHANSIFNCSKSIIAFLLRIIRKIYFDIFFHSFKREVEKTDIVFSNYLIGWRKYIHPNGLAYEYDLFLGDVIEKAKDKFKILCIDMGSGQILRTYKETKNKFSKSKDWICFEQFITFRNIFLALSLSIKKSFGRQIDKNLKNIQKKLDPLFIETFLIC